MLGSALKHLRATKHSILVMRKRLVSMSRIAQRAVDPRSRRMMKSVEADMTFPEIPRHRRVPGSVWAVAVVRNESDVIAATVEHLFRQGVDGVLIADNGSTDDTRAILDDLASRYQVVVGSDAMRAHHHGPKMTFLARFAADRGADWIVPFDADELWFGAAGERLVDTLRRAPTGVASASIYNCFPDPEGDEGAWRLDPIPARLLKVAFRWRHSAQLHHGNHGVLHPEQPHLLLNIVHFPWRSFRQFRDKVRHGAAVLEAAGFVFEGEDHWRTLGQLSDNQLQDAWRSLLCGDAPASYEWVPQGPLHAVDPIKWAVWPADPTHPEAAPRVRVYTRSINDELYALSSGTVALPYPRVRVLGSTALSYLVQLVEDVDADIVVNIDEDAYVTNVSALKELIDHVIEHGYANAGVPDGGVVHHRPFNPRTTNPFFNVFNTRLIRENYSRDCYVGYPTSDDDLIAHHPVGLIRDAYTEGEHEPYDEFFNWLNATLPVLYLDGTLHADGLSTLVHNHAGKPFLLHTWFAREFRRDAGHTRRILARIDEAYGGRAITRRRRLQIERDLLSLKIAKRIVYELRRRYQI